jgi:hypothetical protein
MTAVVQITHSGRTETEHGSHDTRWHFHTDDGRTVDAELSTFVRHPTEPGQWRYSLLTFDDGATIEKIGEPLNLYIANASAAFGTLTAAAAYVIGGAS